MPFTPAHAAAVLPLLKLNNRFVSGTGLIIGSMAPDFEYFLRMREVGMYSHSLPSLLYFNLPITTALAFGFHLAVKRNLISNLPYSLQSRFQPVLHFDFKAYFVKHYLAFSICALIGAGTHIVWDSFTHRNRYFSARVFHYDRNMVEVGDFEIQLVNILQHGSTFIGLVLIVIYVISLKPHTGAELVKPEVRYWLYVVGITLLVTGLRFLIFSADFRIDNLVVCLISGFCIALICCGIGNFWKTN